MRAVKRSLYFQGFTDHILIKTSRSCALLFAAGLAFSISPSPGIADPLIPQISQTVQSPSPSDITQDLLQEDVYILGPGDSLSLRFLLETTLTSQIDVLNDGTASLPLLGTVRLSGLTLSQATLWLQSLYSRQLLRPEFQLSIVRARPLRVAIVGEVERQGVYTMTTTEASKTEAAVTISGLPTLVDAIQKAGGITDQADLTQVVLQRRLPGDRPIFKRTRLNLLNLVFEGDLQQNPLLFDGDTIRVMKAAEPTELATELSSTTLAPSSITVNVVGEVKGAGRIILPANTSLLQAILAAGGPIRWRANSDDVELVRINRNGTVTREKFRIDYSQGVSNAKNPPLRDRDTVIVNRSPLAQTSDALGAFANPIGSVVNLWALYDIIDRRR
jgi:polysaccharide export outer membrane protein